MISPLILGSIATSWGVATHNSGLIAFSSSVLADKNMTFLIGAVIIILFTATTLLGMKVYFTLQNVSFVLMLTALLITLAAFVLNTPASFATLIDNALGSGTYSGTIQSFQSQFQSTQALERPALIAIPSGIVLWAGINTWAMGTSLIAGEVKEEAKLRTWLIANVLGTLCTGGTFALTAYLYFSSVGDKFIYAMAYLNGSPAYKLQFLPYYSSFVPLAFPNPIIFMLFAAGFLLGGIFFMPQNQILSSRVMLAWSFDRIMPRQLGHVDRKFHNPVVATLIALIISLIALWIFVYTPWLGFFSQLFAVAFSFFVTSVAATVFPFRKKEMFDSSPVRWRIGGLPLMTLIGMANAIFMLIFMYQNWTDSALGSNSPQSLTLIVSIFVAAFALYWVIRASRKRQGIDIDAVFRELPPE
jgi:amino acid transporter